MTRFAIDPGFAEKSKAELSNGQRIVMLYGCSIDCARKIVSENGIEHFEHIHSTDFGIVKGQAPVTEAKINEICKFLKK